MRRCTVGVVDRTSLTADTVMVRLVSAEPENERKPSRATVGCSGEVGVSLQLTVAGGLVARDSCVKLKGCGGRREQMKIKDLRTNVTEYTCTLPGA